MTKRKLEGAYDLSYDVVAEVLSYLPAKQVCKFRRANQVIYDFTSNRNFALKQTSRVKTACGLFVQDRYQNIKDLVLLSDNEEDDNNTMSCSSGVSDDFFSGDDSIIVGCNNGVVVYEEQPKYVGHSQLCIINPVTLQRRTIPRPTTSSASRLLGSVMMLGEQQKGNSVDYSLFCFLSTGDWDNYVEYRVYSSKENRWMEESNKRLDVGCRSLKYGRPILVEKTIYFVSDCCPSFRSEPYIVAVDVDQHSSEILPLPVPVISCDYEIEISEWGDHHDSSLCLIRRCKSNSTFTIWIVEERKRWIWSSTPIEITFESMGLGRPTTEEEEVTCFTLVNGDKLVFNIDSAIHVYGLRDGRRSTLKKELSGRYLSLFPYANTLCPC